MIDLRPDHLSLVRDILRAGAPGCEVWVFGSRAQGKAKPMSDLDLAIVCPQKTDPMLIENLRDAFDDSPLPIKVDLVDWARTDEAFRRIIEEQKIIL